MLIHTSFYFLISRICQLLTNNGRGSHCYYFWFVENNEEPIDIEDHFFRFNN